MSYESVAGFDDKIVINNNGWVISEGNIPAIVWYTGKKNPKLHQEAVVTDPKFGKCSDPTVESIFGLEKRELQRVADIVVTNVSYLPPELPDMTFIYVRGNAIFTSTNPLDGSGVLFVDGDLNIAPDSDSIFNGFIYVTGEAVIAEPALINGGVVGYNRFELSRNESVNVAKVQHNSSILANVREITCNYKENKSTLHVFIGIPELE
jgi:hypothetical protein